jgi:xanthine dehydrogenase accessory factor
LCHADRKTTKGVQKAQRKQKMKVPTVVIKGAGEMATGIACRLYMANIKNILMLEIPQPLAVRRTVAFCESIYHREVEVEGIRGIFAEDLNELPRLWDKKKIAVMVDPKWRLTDILKPDVMIDAIMAKKNLGTHIKEAPLVIGVGPGFTAPFDVHIVIESNRGHNLGRAIYRGAAEPATGIPGFTAGFSIERVLRSPHEGLVRHARKDIGSTVKKGEIALYVDKTPVFACIDGILRGLVREIPVKYNEKLGDIEPRDDAICCNTISDKARAIAGGVLEALMHKLRQ